MKKKYDYFIYYFPLFAFLFIGMGSILLSVSLSSCSSSVKNPLLLCADSLMEVSPDSAEGTEKVSLQLFKELNLHIACILFGYVQIFCTLMP